MPYIAQICRRLDGIPLALELPAARVRVFTPAQLASRLDERFAILTQGSRTALPRQQTMRATIDWSYELLNADEQLLLRRTSIFAGGWTLDAALDVCATGPLDTRAVVEALTSLVEKSLVVANSGPRADATGCSNRRTHTHARNSRRAASMNSSHSGTRRGWPG